MFKINAYIYVLQSWSQQVFDNKVSISHICQYLSCKIDTIDEINPYTIKNVVLYMNILITFFSCYSITLRKYTIEQMRNDEEIIKSTSQLFSMFHYIKKRAKCTGITYWSDLLLFPCYLWFVWEQVKMDLVRSKF